MACTSTCDTRRPGATGPRLLLLHGFPQSHLILQEVAPRLAPQPTMRRIDYIPQQVRERLVDEMLGFFGE